ncbi:ECF transporter S component [Candidatus Woesearchaeota archaeon]|nr:MAG: ECF transporter S component [Candidatus Woesearchaeota archaeon]
MKAEAAHQEELQQRQETSVRLGLRALETQLRLYNLQEWVLVASFIASAGVLRIAMQFLPNVEPLTFFALLAGALFGWRKGFLVGASSLWWSNYFVIGGQGPWSFFQAASFGIAGILGSFIPVKGRNSRGSTWRIIPFALVASLIATALFEIIMNLGWAFMFGMSPLAVFASGLPLFGVHLASNLSFAVLIPKFGGLIYEKAGLADRALCRHLIARIRSGNGIPGRLPGKRSH